MATLPPVARHDNVTKFNAFVLLTASRAKNFVSPLSNQLEVKMIRQKGIFFWLAVAVFLNASLSTGLSQFQPEKVDKAEELRREIQVLNLVNGLDLTQEQMEMIMKNAKECLKLREQFKSILLARNDEMGRMLAEIRGYLYQKKEIPPALAQNYRRLDGEIKRARLEMGEKINALAKNIEESLASHQLYQLQKFIPCIIPPKGEERIGQAADYKGLAQNLERIREIPDYLYQRKKEEIFARALENMKLHTPPGVKIEEKEMKKLLEAVFDEVRSLEDVEFEIQKERLAERLASPLKPQALLDDPSRKIAAFLLSPEIIPVLEKRMMN